VTHKLIRRVLKSLNIWFSLGFVRILAAFRLVRKLAKCGAIMTVGSAHVMDHITIRQAGSAKGLHRQI
jgi:hypothetical protein